MLKEVDQKKIVKNVPAKKEYTRDKKDMTCLVIQSN